MVFEQAIKIMLELGIYSYVLPFFISLAFIYALIRKAKVFESPLVAATVSLAIALLIFAFPVLVGVSLAKPFSAFFTQLTIVMILIGMVLLVAALFIPNVAEMIAGKARNAVFAIAIFSIIIVFFTSGLMSAFTTQPAMPVNLQALYFIIALIVMASLIILAARVAS